MGVPHFSAPAVGDSLRISGLYLPETRGIVLPDAENSTILRIFIPLDSDTIPERDGQTDGRTEMF